jgi:hypothetical protein
VVEEPADEVCIQVGQRQLGWATLVARWA